MLNQLHQRFAPPPVQTAGGVPAGGWRRRCLLRALLGLKFLPGRASPGLRLFHAWIQQPLGSACKHASWCPAQTYRRKSRAKCAVVICVCSTIHNFCFYLTNGSTRAVGQYDGALQLSPLSAVTSLLTPDELDSSRALQLIAADRKCR